LNRNKIISLTNKVSLVAIILLIYWVFIFISISVFGLKVFKENITETFYFSILGILALLSGSLIVNIMYNLTKISDVLSEEYKPFIESLAKIKYLIYLASFPIIFILLFIGDYRTSSVKEQKLIEAANYIVENNMPALSKMSEFNLDSTYFSNTENSIKLITKESESIPSLSIIVEQQIEERKTFIIIDGFNYWNKKKKLVDFVYSCSKDEREYLNSVFNSTNIKQLFSSHDGNYELYYPLDTNKNKLVIYITDRQRYGKLGS